MNKEAARGMRPARRPNLSRPRRLAKDMQTPTENTRPYSSSDALKAAGISRNALLNYERHGIVTPLRDENGYRTYTQSDLLDIMCCTMLISLGYTVSEAATMLNGKDVMNAQLIDTYLLKLEHQRDSAQAKHDNLTEFRSIIAQAQPPDRSPIDLVECPPWLFFFDTYRTTHDAIGVPNDPRASNQIQLMRSVPLSCRGFEIKDFFTNSPQLRWARTLRQSHKELLDVDVTKAEIRGGTCLRTVIQASYPNLDPNRVLAQRVQDYLASSRMQTTKSPFVPMLFNNRRPSPVFEIYIPVEKSLEL